MTHAMATGLLACTLGLAACGGGGRNVQVDPEDEIIGTRWNAILATPPELHGALSVKGMGWLAPEDGDTTRSRAYVKVENAVPGGEHPWHVHRGQCGNDRGIFGPPDSYQPLEVKGDGEAESTAEIREPFPRAGQYFINVHASANNLRTIIACGNLAPPVR
jgi:hypothetical protein